MDALLTLAYNKREGKGVAAHPARHDQKCIHKFFGDESVHLKRDMGPMWSDDLTWFYQIPKTAYTQILS